MGRKAYIIHPAEKEALAILYSRFIETGMIHEELANKLTTLGKTSAFNSLKGNRGTTITEFEELCIVLGMSAVKVLKQAESAKHHHLLKLPLLVFSVCACWGWGLRVAEEPGAVNSVRA